MLTRLVGLTVLRRSLLSLLLVAAACEPAARMRVGGDVVTAIRFEGNGAAFSGQNDYQLRSAMEQGESGFGVLTWPLSHLVEPVALDPEALARDATRLEVWYAHHGWLDAKVSGWELQRVRDRTRRRAGAVRVVGHVVPGEPSTISSVEVEGLSRGLELLGATALRRSGLAVGQQFSLESADYARTLLGDGLREQGFPRALVTLDVEARPGDYEVDVVVRVDAGSSADFGEVRVEGLSKVPRRAVETAIPIVPGSPFRLSALRTAQQRLFELGTFSTVTVTPRLDGDDPEVVPIDVKVVEGRPGSAQVGVGLRYVGTLLEPRLTGSLAHVNLGRRLVRGEVSGSVGYAFAVGGSGTGKSLPTFSLEGSLGMPRPAGGGLQPALRAGVRQATAPGGQAMWFERWAAVDVGWRPDARWVLQVGPEWRRADPLGVSPVGLAVLEEVRGDALGLYSLAALGAQVVRDSRDDPVDPRRGSRVEGSVRTAFPVLGSDVFFSEISFDARRYFRPFPQGEGFRAVVAVRGFGKLVQPWGDSRLPWREMAFLGGGNENRGYRIDGVGGYDCLCDYETIDPPPKDPTASTENLTYRYVPRGGRVKLGGSVELRYLVGWGVSVVPFVDVGVLEEVVRDLRRPDVRLGTGLGVRYATAAGPVRLDVGLRPTSGADAFNPATTRYIGCDPVDRAPRAFDLISQFRRARLLGTPFPVEESPAQKVAVNVFFSIEQAF